MKMKPSLEKQPGRQEAKPKPSDDGRLVLKMPSMSGRPEVKLPVDGAGTIANSEKTDEITGNSDRLELRMGGRKTDKKDDEDPFGGSLPPRVAALMPNGASVGAISGGPFSDHVEGVEEGEGTFLNAREYKYAVFFNRVKRSVSQVWDPGKQLYKRDPTGAIFGQRDRLTVLRVVLDGVGGLKDATVEKKSGLDFLDQEAITAFKKAQPFPNPPQGLVRDGEIAFTFGFYVEFSSSSFKLFRYAN
jgi:TonB family protein